MHRITAPLDAARALWASRPASNGSVPPWMSRKARWVVIVRRPFGRRREIAHALGERLADGLGGAEPLGGHGELVPDHEPEQRSAGPHQEPGIEGVVRDVCRQKVSTTAPLCGATRPAKPRRSACGPM